MPEAREVKAFTAVAYARFAPDTDPGAISEATALLAERGYTRAELCYAAAQMPFDAGVAESIEHKTRNPFWLLAATDRIIQTSRKVRSGLGRIVDSFEKKRLLDMCPELRDSDFHICRFDSDGRAEYRYAPSANRSEEAQEALKNLLSQ